MKDSVLGMGVIGTGSIGIRGALDHLVVPDIHDRVRAAAVCDAVPGRAQAAAEKYGVPNAYDSYEELLADPAVDAVTLCTPIGLHFDQGLAAIRAGKHVHFNKTITLTYDEAKQLIDEAAAKDVRLVASPGQMVRYPYQRLRELVADGAIGKVAWAATGAAFGSYHEQEGLRTGDDVLTNINPSWYWRKPGGGPLYDMTVYGLHTLTGILGPAKKVTALSGILIPEREFQGQMYETSADDNSVMLLDFGGGTFAFVQGTATGSLGGYFHEPTFFGTGGTIQGLKLNGEEIDWEGKGERHAWGPHIVGEHVKMGEHHVFEDLMQLV
ncbi:Gfo/Idh/MocA family oxidoreductase, partial [bacterium]